MTILRATKDNSKAILTPFEQGVGETDWRRYQARVKGRGKVLSIDAGQTTSTTLVASGREVFEGDQLYLQEGLDTTVKPALAGTVTGTASTLDILGDGSCIAAYNLDGNASDISGNYNGTWTGTEQYAQAVYGQGALFNGSSYVSNGSVTGAKAASFRIYIPPEVSLTGRRSYIQAGIMHFLEDFGNGRPIYLVLGASVGYVLDALPERGVFVHYLVTDAPAAYVNRVGAGLTGSGSGGVPSYPFRIGGSTLGYLNNGSIIDQVRLFNKNTFTQEEVDTIYAEAAQAIDISSAGFTNAPTRAVLKAPSIDICLEDEVRRCISADYNVPITQAFNDTIVTSLPEFNTTTRDCLDVGDNIVLTVDGSPVTTEILTIDKSTPNQYTITFAPQPTPPTACTVPSRAVAQTNPTPVGNWDGDDMTLEYDVVLKQGRALEISVQGDNAHEVAQVNVDLYKEVI